VLAVAGGILIALVILAALRTLGRIIVVLFVLAAIGCLVGH
jgi:hypothetical protein